MKRPILTQEKQARMELYAAIARRYKELNVEGSHISAVVAVLMDEFSVSRDLVYKVKRLYRLHKRRINRCNLISYHEQLISSGKTSSEAKEETAKQFKCTTGYVYQLVKMASV